MPSLLRPVHDSTSERGVQIPLYSSEHKDAAVGRIFHAAAQRAQKIGSNETV
jgi:hypothetical protein